MNWQLLSVASCLLFGMGAISATIASKTQTGFTTMVCYGTGFLAIALLAAFFKRKQVEFHSVPVVWGIIAGLCGGTAGLLQFISMSKWQTDAPWIVLIGGLYPAVMIFYSLATGKQFTTIQWLGVGFALVSIVLICMPTETQPGSNQP